MQFLFRFQIPCVWNAHGSYAISDYVARMVAMKFAMKARASSKGRFAMKIGKVSKGRKATKGKTVTADTDSEKDDPLALAVILNKPANNDDYGDDDTVDKLKARCPQRLKDWLNDKLKGTQKPWDRNLSQAVIDWQKSFKNHGHPKTAKMIEDSKKSDDHVGTLCKLFVVKKNADLVIIPTS